MAKNSKGLMVMPEMAPHFDVEAKRRGTIVHVSGRVGQEKRAARAIKKLLQSTRSCLDGLVEAANEEDYD